MPRRVPQPRARVSPFFLAALPALEHRAPLTSRLVARSSEREALGLADLLEGQAAGAFSEERIVDASWEPDELGGVRAVGTITSLLDEDAPELDDAGSLAAFAPVQPEGKPTKRVVPDLEGEPVRGVVVSGPVDGLSHVAKAFVAYVPEAKVVVQVVVARRAHEGSLVSVEDVDALFEATLKRTTIGAAPSQLTPSLVTPRVSFEANAMLVRCDGASWLALRRDDEESLVEYRELPVGLFEVLEPASDDFTVDAKGQFCFTRGFAKRAKVQRQRRTIAGLAGKVPVDLWAAGDDAGFALVRDGVLHFARVGRGTLEQVAHMLDTLRFEPAGQALDRLIDRGPMLLATHLYRPMQPSFAQTIRRAKKGAR